MTQVLPTASGEYNFCPTCGTPLLAAAADGVALEEEPVYEEEAPSGPLGWIKQAFGQPGTTSYRIISLLVLVLVYLSIGSIVLESIAALEESFSSVFFALEIGITILFTIEYICNIYAAPNRRAYILGPWGIIDLLAIAPTLIGFIDLRFLRIVRTLRILRILRILKVARMVRATRASRLRAGESLDSSLSYDLQIYAVGLVSLVVIAATLLFDAEGGEGTAFPHIPAAMWWVLQTIGFSSPDAGSPVTAAGRGVAVATMLGSLALFAYLIGAVSRAMRGSPAAAAPTYAVPVYTTVPADQGATAQPATMSEERVP